MIDDERELWREKDVTCVMVSCCAGAELQLRRSGEIVLRELYPMKSDLYERARELQSEWQAQMRATS
jgi:hypothetical protein